MRLSTNCSEMVYCESDWESLKSTCCSLSRKYNPQYGFIFGVLPFSNCNQYKWTKYFARNFGFASQCVLIENIVSNFVATGVDLDTIVKNMSEGILKNVETLEK
uniref:Uncharacterized protein n=1 Tax=Romanomermis culicivorax TaxID=13658 RepID=A0A915INC3_ROMCU